MVRAIIGVMLKVASGKIELSEFIKKFKKGEQLSIQYAPSNALVLYKINY
jgi:tRNA U38,U39,U40 pseudouridine synthase TruA